MQPERDTTPEVRTGFARSGDLDIAYEDMGNPDHPAVLLIMGLGAQLLLWRKGFCDKLVERGYRVIRFDNRDVGLSTKIEGRRSGSALLPRMLRSYAGLRSDAVYTLEDMADDAAALLDHLQIEQAHIVGGSMGGMIAQVFAARYQHRTKTLGVIFRVTTSRCCRRPGRSNSRPSRRGRRTRRAPASSPTRSTSAASSVAPATLRRSTGPRPTPPKATTAPTTPSAWPGTSGPSWAAAACGATTR